MAARTGRPTFRCRPPNREAIGPQARSTTRNHLSFAIAADDQAVLILVEAV